MADTTKHIATVLVVDDEPILRMDAVDILERGGFETVEAKNAAEALRILAERPDIRLLFTDVNMPGMNGVDLARQVHERWPNVLLVVTSSGPAIADKDLPDDGRFLAKPYAAETLKGQVDIMIEKADDR